jgi:hypothetical protein
MYGQPKETLTSSRIAVAVWSIALFFTLAIGLAAQVVLGRIS